MVKKIRRRAERTNENPAQEISDLQAAAKKLGRKGGRTRRTTVPSQAARPGVASRSASAGMSRPLGLPARPRRAAFTQGTRASRAALARWMRKYRTERAHDAARVAGGDKINPMTQAQYYAKWGHGDAGLRRKAEQAAQVERARLERNR